MITSSEIRIRKIAALHPGEELIFEGCSPRDGVPWNARVRLEAAPPDSCPAPHWQFDNHLIIVDTCWSGDGAGVEPFKLRRTFTTAGYANNYLLTNC